MKRKIIITEAQARRIINEVSYDMSEVGEIECCLDFDEDAYEEYLTDNELTDSMESRMSFVRDCYIEYDVELKDPETYHTFAYERMTIDDIEQNFGAAIANDVLQDCMDGKSHRYEPLAYDNEAVDLTNPKALSDAAMKRLKSGGYTKNCRGFILPNGVVVYTGAEHNMCSQIPGVQGTYHFIELGCIRVLDHSVDLAQPPTPEQRQTLQQVFDAYYGDTLYLDLMNKYIGAASKQYQELYPEEAFRDINNYFNYGVKPRQGYGMFESVFRGKKSVFTKWFKLHENMDELTLYHGSCADFNQFDDKYVLTGVGKLDYGYGFYLTTSQEVAHNCALGGKLYTVEVPDGKYLNAGPVSRGEALRIAKAFGRYYLGTEFGREAYSGHENEFWDAYGKYIAESEDGNHVYGTISTVLGDDKYASEYLHSIGYVGLKIDDASTYTNYLIFDKNDLKIIGKADF